jgi:hypothetical protein
MVAPAREIEIENPNGAREWREGGRKLRQLVLPLGGDGDDQTEMAEEISAVGWDRWARGEDVTGRRIWSRVSGGVGGEDGGAALLFPPFQGGPGGWASDCHQPVQTGPVV